MPKRNEPVEKVEPNTTEIKTGTYFVMVQSESVLEMVKVDVCFAMSAVIGEFGAIRLDMDHLKHGRRPY